MPDSNIPEIYERVVKIKELPIKTSVTEDSVLLIEDDEDTKQMSVKLFYDLIDNLSVQAIDMIKARIESYDAWFEKTGDMIDDWKAAEDERKKNEDARIAAENERKKNEEDRTNTFENDWKPFIEDAEKAEQERQDNEKYTSIIRCGYSRFA